MYNGNGAYADQTLHQIMTLLLNLISYQIMRCFLKAFATGVACR